MLKPMNKDSNIPDTWVKVAEHEYIVPIKENTTKRKMVSYESDKWLDDGDEVYNKRMTTEEEAENQKVEKMKREADIYKLNYKEFQVYIYHQLEEIKLSLQSLLEVAKQGGK